MYKSDSIAAAMANGSSSLGTGDAAASMVGAAAFVGAARGAATAAASATSGAAKSAKGLTATNAGASGGGGSSGVVPSAPKRSMKDAGGSESNNSTTTNSAPKRPDANSQSSASDAGIAGANSSGHSSDPKFDQVMDALSKMSEPKKPGLKDGMTNLAQQHAQEKTTVGISMRGHSD